MGGTAMLQVAEVSWHLPPMLAGHEALWSAVGNQGCAATEVEVGGGD